MYLNIILIVKKKELYSQSGSSFTVITVSRSNWNFNMLASVDQG